MPKDHKIRTSAEKSNAKARQAAVAPPPAPEAENAAARAAAAETVKRQKSIARSKAAKREGRHISGVDQFDVATGDLEQKRRKKLDPKFYESELARLQVELVKLQEWIKLRGLKVVCLFEGRDAAGKGGVIKRITETLNPRVCRITALGIPTDREKTQWYFQRYAAQLPAAGEWVNFDRSWYNRAGVERVMGFCSDEQVKDFLRVAPAVEKAMVDSGIILLKYWLEVSPEEQTRRLKARIDDGRKIWKLTPMDLKSYGRWHDYSRARDAMFAATDTEWAPWFVARSDDKRRARLNIISHLLASVPYQPAPRPKVKLPKRGDAGGYREPDYPYKFVAEKY